MSYDRYCTAYCLVLCCTVVYSTLLYSTLLYSTLLYSTLLHYVLKLLSVNLLQPFLFISLHTSFPPLLFLSLQQTGHQQAVNHIAFSPDARFLASASFDKKVKLWCGKTGRFLATLNSHVGSGKNTKLEIICMCIFFSLFNLRGLITSLYFYLFVLLNDMMFQ